MKLMVVVMFTRYLIFLPQRQLGLLLLQFLRTVHHKVDDVDAASQEQQH